MERLKNEFQRARLQLQKAREAMVKQEAQRRRPQEFEVNDRVLLSTANLRFKGYPRKLQRKYIGPFKVILKISPVAYKLELPDGWTIHNVFHTSLLKLWQQGPWSPEDEDDLPELETEDQEIFESEKILRWRRTKVGNVTKREFLVLWKDRPAEECSWVMEEDFVDKNELEEQLSTDKPIFVRD